MSGKRVRDRKKRNKQERSRASEARASENAACDCEESASENAARAFESGALEGANPEDPFREVRERLARRDTDGAQRFLDSVEERGAEWQFMQAKVFRAKKWYTESKRCLERAMKESPDNELYKKEYDELLALAGKGRKKKPREQAQMGDEAAGFCAECCVTGLCTCVCESCDGF